MTDLVDEGPGTVPRPAGTAIDGVTPASLEAVTHDYSDRRTAETQELIDRHETHLARFPRPTVSDGAIVHRHYGVSPDDVEPLELDGCPPGTPTGDPDTLLGVATIPAAGDILATDAYGPPDGLHLTHTELDELRDAGWDTADLETVPTSVIVEVRTVVAGRTSRRPR